MVREPWWTVGRWEARGCRRCCRQPVTSSPFPSLGLTHRSPGFSRTRVAIPSFGWQLSRINSAECGGRTRGAPGDCQTRGEEAESRLLLVQWKSAGLWSLHANKKKAPCSCAPGAFSHIDELGSKNSFRKLLLLAPFYRRVRD